MANDFYLDKNGVQGAADGLQSAGADMADSFKKLDDGLTPYVGCWGNDDIGKAFEKDYWTNATKMIDSYRPAGENMMNSADNLRQTAQYLSSVDLGTAKVLDSAKPPEQS